MLAFCAYWEGAVIGSVEEFERHVRDTHLPLVARYPRLKALRYLKGVPRDGAPPRYWLSFELFFDSWEDFEVAKQSEARERAVADAERLLTRFDGSVEHVVYEVNDVDIPR